MRYIWHLSSRLFSIFCELSYLYFFQAWQIIKMEFDSDWITFIIASLAVFILVCIAVILGKTCSKYFCSGCDKHQNDEELGMWWRGPGPNLNKQLKFERSIFLTSTSPFDPLDWCFTQWEQLPLTCMRAWSRSLIYHSHSANYWASYIRTQPRAT